MIANGMSRRCGRALWAASLSVMAFLSVQGQIRAADIYWQASAEMDWSTPSAWSLARVPTSSDVVYINNGGTADLVLSGSAWTLYLDPGTVNLSGTGRLTAPAEQIGVFYAGSFTQSGGTNTANIGLWLGCNLGSSGTYRLYGGQLTANEEQIGSEGTGSFLHTAGTHSASSLYVAYWEGSNGSYELTGTGQLNVGAEEYIGRSGYGSFTQSGGTHTVSGGDGMSLGYYPGSRGAYVMSGEAQLTTIVEYVGYGGQGSFIQSGGTNTSSRLYVGYNVGSSGTYQLSGTGRLAVQTESIHGTFEQTGGTNAVSGNLFLGGLGRYQLSGPGELTAENETVATSGAGTFKFVQSDGSNTVNDTLYIGSSGIGTYELSGAGMLRTGTEYVGYKGSGSFTQTGGIHTVAGTLYIGGYTSSMGTCRLNGAGQMSAGSESIGSVSAGTFIQTTGTNTTGLLSIGAQGLYQFSGGALQVTSGLALAGTLDFMGGNGALTAVGSIVDLTGGTVRNMSGARLIITGTNSLLIAKQGFDPATAFAGYSNEGFTLIVGTPLVIPEGSGPTWSGTLPTFVDCRGTLTATAGQGLNITGGMLVSGTGYADLGSGSVTFSGTRSGLRDAGYLAATREYIGSVAGDLFVHAAGTNLCRTTLFLASGTGSSGTYELSGTGQLAVPDAYVGHSGTGRFTHSGGSHTVSSCLRLGYNAGSNGTYELSGTGALIAGSEYVGYFGTGRFTHSGGTHTVSGSFWLGYNAGSNGTYELNGTGTLAVGTAYIGNSGSAQFTQTGGTHAVGSGLYLGRNAGANGTYELSGTGTLAVGAAYIGYDGSGRFTQTGGAHAVGAGLYLGYNTTSSGTYALSGDGQLRAWNEYVGNTGIGTFIQDGGSHDVTGILYLGCNTGSAGTYQLGGTGQLAVAGTEYVGQSGTGTFLQTGGTNTTALLTIGTRGTYQLGGGVLLVTSGLTLVGTLDFMGTAGTLVTGGDIVDFSAGTVRNTSSASLALTGTCPLLIVKPGLDPSRDFASFTSNGITHVAGTPLVVPVDRSYCWRGAVNDYVECQGTLGTPANGALNLAQGLSVSGTGSIDLGSGSVTFTGTRSGIRDTGYLAAANEYLGSGTGDSFNHSGGTNYCRGSLFVGYSAGSNGTYLLSDGLLSANASYVGYNGSGTFNQTGGTHTAGSLRVGSASGAHGTYLLSGTGTLTVYLEYLGDSGMDSFVQTGGSHTVTGIMYCGYGTGRLGTYQLAGTGQLDSSHFYIGYYDGMGAFTQSGGTHTGGEVIVGYSGTGTYTQTAGTFSASVLTLGQEWKVGMGNPSNGSYDLSGTGQLTVASESVGSKGIGHFTQTGGIHTVTGCLSVASVAGDTYYHLGGIGQLAVGSLVVGSWGSFYGDIGGTFAFNDAAAQVTIRNSLSFGARGVLTAVPGCAIHMSGTALQNSSTRPTNLAGLANVNLIVEGGAANVLAYEVAGKDLGATPAGWTNNFALGTLTLGNAESLASGGTGDGAIGLVNSSSNNIGWSSAEALYVNNLVLNAGATINLNGLHLYYLVDGVPHSFTGTLLPGDATLDGIVDQADYTVWYSGYGVAGGWSQGDFTGDNLIDQADYTIWYNNYGSTGGSVPEPATLVLLALGGLAMLRRRK